MKPTRGNLKQLARILDGPLPDPTEGAECKLCHEAMTIRPGDDPTHLCDNCAQEVVEDVLPGLIEHVLKEH